MLAHATQTKMEISAGRIWHRHREAYILLALPLAIILLFRVFTIFLAVRISFLRYGPNSSQFVGLANYVRVVGDKLFWRAMGNTLYYTIGVVPLGIVVSLVLAQLVFALGRRMQVVYKAAFYLPSVVSGVVLSMVWLWLFDPTYGLLNWLLVQLGLEPLLWLRSPRTAMPSLIVMELVTGQGARVILLTAAMGSIPETLYESARVDGATGWHLFWYITIPLLRPTLLYLLIIGTISSFQVFHPIFVMTSGGPYHATETAVYQLYSYAYQLLDFGRASAIGVILALILLGVSAVQYLAISGHEVEY